MPGTFQPNAAFKRPVLLELYLRSTVTAQSRGDADYPTIPPCARSISILAFLNSGK
jgi:hypothetical protein